MTMRELLNPGHIHARMGKEEDDRIPMPKMLRMRPVEPYSQQPKPAQDSSAGFRASQSEVVAAMEEAVARFNPLDQIACHLRFLSYGNMMLLAKELAAIFPESGEPGPMAETLHKWAVSKLPENLRSKEQYAGPNTYHKQETRASDGYAIEWNGEQHQSVFPEKDADKSRLHASVQDALAYMTEECLIPRDWINVCEPHSD